MNAVQLLDKTRKIGKLLHNNYSDKVVFNDICEFMRDILVSNVVVISRKGKVLGTAKTDSVPLINEMLESKVGTFIDPELNERFLGILSTKENVALRTLGFERKESAKLTAVVVPIEVSGARLGTLFVYKQLGEYEIEDILLCEYGNTVVGLEMLRSVSEENEAEVRRAGLVESAISTLSYSEMEAIVNIFAELGGAKEGILVASKIADRAGITRSVIVNALRKLESAGVIESRSSGMKGTYIKILNDLVFEEVDKLQKEQGIKIKI
ncbi:MAG: GTP-sensing pleiotropic transcriptional regulator CodY [Lachnospiraceae bacterium]|nr:GTP-sensing pleiotropic transcriptional regulator CodY [Lachnospiraceae bacterium]